jgi:anti-sigma regulatory factor (Ser/Thr protein kinase)
MDYRYKKTIADFDLELLNGEIESFCGENGEIPPGTLFTAQLVIEELVTNIVKYGSRGAKEKSIEIRLRDENGKIILTISDDTDAFNPLEAEEPDVTLPAEEREAGGLGIFLVRKKVRSITYEYKNGLNTVEVIC